MKKLAYPELSRRDFMASASSLMLGSCVLSLTPFKISRVQSIQELREELTPEELKLVEQSVMAQDIKNYFGKGYS